MAIGAVYTIQIEDTINESTSSKAYRYVGLS